MLKTLLRIKVIFVFMFISLSCSAEKTITEDFDNGVSLTLITKPFVQSSHKVETCGKRKKPCSIDGTIFYGGKGKLPTEEIIGLKFKRDGTVVNLDTSSIFNPGIKISNIKKRFTVQEYLGRNSYRVIGYFGEGKVSYIGHWLIVNNSSIRNHLSDYESLVSLLFEVKKDFKINH